MATFSSLALTVIQLSNTQAQQSMSEKGHQNKMNKREAGF